MKRDRYSTLQAVGPLHRSMETTFQNRRQNNTYVTILITFFWHLLLQEQGTTSLPRSNSPLSSSLPPQARTSQSKVRDLRALYYRRDCATLFNRWSVLFLGDNPEEKLCNPIGLNYLFIVSSDFSTPCKASNKTYHVQASGASTNFNKQIIESNSSLLYVCPPSALSLSVNK